MKHKEKILELRQKGCTYNKIQEELGCSRATISYHCSKFGKEKVRLRAKRIVKNHKYILRKRIYDFKRKRYHGKLLDNCDLCISEACKRLLENPICYITGKPIDFEDPYSYNIDHIIPISKGGNSCPDNIGLTLRKANMAKNDLSIDELIELCKDVLTHNGYKILK